MPAAAAIIGSGNIGSDLLRKIRRQESDGLLNVLAMAGNDPQSTGLAAAAEMGIQTTADGIDGLLRMPEFEQVQLVFDASSAAAHPRHAQLLATAGRKLIDLTPAAVGPFVVPTVNLDQHLDAANINMVTCGGQATVPVVAAIRQAVEQCNASATTPLPLLEGSAEPLHLFYAEIVSSIASRSAGPGTRANIDEFTRTTARALEQVGGAEHGKAIIVLNPAEPPLLMRNTVICFVTQHPQLQPQQATVLAPQLAAMAEQSIHEMVGQVQDIVPGYRLKQKVVIDRFEKQTVTLPGLGTNLTGWRIAVFLEVEGAGDFLPTYAGNLDIMTAAAVGTARRWLAR